MAIDGHSLAVIVPSYRAATTIESVITRMPSSVDRIIVVNDCSPDNLIDILKNITDPRMIVLQHEQNQGVGGAMVTGFREALRLRADFIAKIDSDGQMDPEHLPVFVRAALRYNCDYVKANRFGHLEEIRSMPKSRIFGNVVLSFLTKVASGYWNVLDPQNGYLMIRRNTLRRLDLNRIDRTYFFENSMLINLNIFRAKIAEIQLPAVYPEDGVSSLRISRIVRDFPAKLLGSYFYRIWQKYVIRSTSPFALLMAFAGLNIFGGAIWGAFSWYQSVTTGIPATTGTVVIALLPIIVGWVSFLQALLFDVQDSGPTVLLSYDDESISS